MNNTMHNIKPWILLIVTLIAFAITYYIFYQSDQEYKSKLENIERRKDFLYEQLKEKKKIINNTLIRIDSIKRANEELYSEIDTVYIEMKQNRKDYEESIIIVDEYDSNDIIRFFSEYDTQGN